MEEIKVRSNVLMAALNAFLVVLCYAFIIYLTHFYLRYFHDISIPSMIISSISSTPIPLAGRIFEFIGFLVEDILTSTFLLALVYSAYIANYKLTVEQGKIRFKSGFLFLKVEEFDLEDIEQVYLENYNFFRKTKQLCIKALDEDVIKIPYVENAEEIKQRLIAMVKTKHKEVDVDNSLKGPIKVMTWKPA